MERKPIYWKKLKKMYQPIVMCDPYVDPHSNKDTVKKTNISDTHKNWNTEHVLRR